MISSDQTIAEANKFVVFKACNNGLDDARRMAERFGGGNGQIEGFLYKEEHISQRHFVV